MAQTVFNNDTANYTIGRGIVAFSAYDRSTKTYGPLLHLGAIQSLTSAVDVEKLEHESYKSKLGMIDDSVIIKTTVTGSITLDEISWQNLAMAKLAEVLTVTQAEITAGAGSVVIDAADSVANSFHDTGKRNITNVAISGKSEGVDFVTYSSVGYIHIPPGSSLVGSEVTASYDCPAQDFKTLRIFKETSIDGALVFFGDNPRGPNVFLEKWPMVQLTPSGDIGLISSEYQTLTLDIAILDSGDSNAPFGEITMPA